MSKRTEMSWALARAALALASIVSLVAAGDAAGYRAAVAGLDPASVVLERPSGPHGDVGPQQRYPKGREAPASPACAKGACVHWTNSGQHAPRPGDADGDRVPDYVEQVVAALARSVKVQNGKLGWDRAKPDGHLGDPPGARKTGRADLYLLDLGSEIAGFTAVDPRGSGKGRSGWVAIDNDFSEQGSSYLSLLQVTVAHEYNHLLQYGYDVGQEPWLYESMATWMEDRVFPAANLYLGFVRSYAHAAPVPLDKRSAMYGAATLHQFLAAQKGPKLLREVWETARRHDGFARSYKALDAALRRAGLGAESLFARFAASAAIWGDHPAFPDGASLPAVKRTRPLREKPVDEVLSRMSFAIVPLAGNPDPGRLRIRVKAAKGFRGFAGLVGERKGTGVVDGVSRLEGGTAKLKLARPAGMSGIEVVLVDTDFRRDRGSRRYRGDSRRFKVTLR